MKLEEIIESVNAFDANTSNIEVSQLVPVVDKRTLTPARKWKARKKYKIKAKDKSK